MSVKLTQSRRQRGTALVETTICLPLLLFLMLAAGEVTNAFLQHNTLTKAVRDGARYATGSGVALNAAKVVELTPAIVSDTQSLVVFGDTSGTGTPILPNLTLGDVTVSAVGGEVVEVRAAYSYTGILGSVLPAFGFGPDLSLDLNLEASVHMRAL
jgi:hypothetical protein